MIHTKAATPTDVSLRGAVAAAVALSVMVSAWGVGMVALPAVSHPLAGTVGGSLGAAGAATAGVAPSFEPNLGQTAPQVRFVTHAGGSTVFLSANEATWAIPTWDPAGGKTGAGAHHRPAVTGGTAVSMQVRGGDPHAAMSAENELPGIVSYFTGRDRSQWHTGIPTYGSVVAHAVYPGVDLTWHGAAGVLEYDFTLAPGARAGTIDLAFAGTAGLSIDATGSLVISTSAGDLRQHAPHAYQRIAGVTRDVSSHFVLRGANSVGIAVGAYDAARPLIIDPTLAYSTFLGGSGGDGATGVVVDSAGNAYVTGATGSVDFPTTPGAYQTAPSSAFITKLNPSGSGLVYSTYFTWGAAAMVVDAKGDVIIGGQAQGNTLPTTPGAFEPTCPTAVCAYNANAGFVTEFNPTGSALLYSTYLAGTTAGESGVTGVAVGPNNTIYVAGGDVPGGDFPTTPGAFEAVCPSIGPAVECRASFVAILNPVGSGATDLVYSTFLGGNAASLASSIVVDAGGTAYVTGTVEASSDFPTTPGAFQTSSAAHLAAYVTKLKPAGQGARDLVYSTYLGGSQRPRFHQGDVENQPQGIGLGPHGTIYVGGYTTASDFPTTPGAVQRKQTGCTSPYSAYCDAFLSILDPAGRSSADLAYSTLLGGNLAAAAFGLAVDGQGDAYLAGDDRSGDFPTKNPVQSHCCFLSTSYVGFVAKIHPAGHGATDLVFSTFIAGVSDATGVAVDGAGNVYVVGTANTPAPNQKDARFWTTPGAFQPTLPAPQRNAAFVAKYSQVCAGALTGSIHGNVVVQPGTAVCLDHARVSGSVDVLAGGDLGLNNSTIAGGVNSYGATSVTICGSSVSGPVTVATSTGFVNIGDTDSLCLPNTLQQGVSLNGNHRGAELGGNRITGTVTVDGTTGTPYTYEDRIPEIERNVISGGLDCNGNGLVPTNDMQRNTVSGRRAGQCAGL